MIGIIDYGMGNLYSVSKALERMKHDYVVSDSPDVLAKTNGLILPGVGSFKDAMSILEETGLATFIKASVESGKPLLGICLGMQLLFEESDENGLTRGLGLLKGRIERIPARDSEGEIFKVPHMGWNKLMKRNPSPLLKSAEEGYVYFVHSYYANTKESNVILASCIYNVEIPAVVGKGNVMGTQFHPEKSSELGLTLLKNYATIVEGSAAI